MNAPGIPATNDSEQHPPSTYRVRGLLLDQQGRLVLIQRVRRGVPPYWITPGGGLEPEDATAEAALRREIREELGGEISIQALLTTFDQRGQRGDWTRQLVYCGHLLHADPVLRTGAEFSNPARGEYHTEQHPCTSTACAALRILPKALHAFLVQHADHLVTLPDLRQGPLPADWPPVERGGQGGTGAAG